MKKRLFWQIYPAFLAVAVLGLLLISWTAGRIIRQAYEQEKKSSLQRLALASADIFGPAAEQGNLNQIQHLCQTMGAAAGVRFTVIDAAGKVLGDSQGHPQTMASHFDRPEFQAALHGQIGSDSRPSETLDQRMLYVAVPMRQDGRIIAVVRTAVAMTELKTALGLLNRSILHSGLMIAVFLALLSLLFSSMITRPLEQLRQGAQRFAQGDLTHRLAVSNTREIGQLAESMNAMAAQLDQRLRTITAQKNEQQAILSSMTEGVAAFGPAGTVLSLNTAAAEMLQVSAQQAAGRLIEEVVRSIELQQYIRQVLEGDTVPAGCTVQLPEGRSRRLLQVQAAPLRDEAGEKIGAIAVLNDITHIQRLEEIRRDFVANVSHELKTPVTSIKGFIETLLDGALNNPQDCRRFLEIIRRQADRLGSIIDDLLLLASIEQRKEQMRIELEPAPLHAILNAAAEVCQNKAAEKNIPVEIDCPQTLRACVNASLLEQAVVNLLDNAITYSPAGSPVRLEARPDGSDVLIRVIDRGCGIPAEHLPRLFERFYRVDKARSRKLGGTGLGLSIVKHIAGLHNGTVSVESTPGQGSIFTLRIPAAA